MDRKRSQFHPQLDQAILDANAHHPDRWPRGLISELAKIHNTSPSTVFKRREYLCGVVRTNQGPKQLAKSKTVALKAGTVFKNKLNHFQVLITCLKYYRNSSNV